MKNFTTFNKPARCKVTEFIREKINGKYEMLCVEWFFDSRQEALDMIDDINARKPFMAPFMTYVYDEGVKYND